MSENQKAGIFFPFYVGDYLSDTLTLTLQQHGAYLLLLCHQWQHGHFSEEEMHAVCRLPEPFGDPASSTAQAHLKQPQAESKQELTDWFWALKRLLKQDSGGLWFSPRCDKEKLKYLEKKRVFYERAKKGGIAKAQKRASSTASSTAQADEKQSLSTAQADKKQDSSSAKAVLLAPKSEVSTSTKTSPTPTPTPGAGAGDESKIIPSRQLRTSKSETRAKLGKKPAAAVPNRAGAGKAQTSSKEGVAGPGKRGARAFNSRSDPENAESAAENPESVNQAKFSGESKTEIFHFWEGAGIEQFECPWSHLEDRALKDFLNANPKVDLLRFRQLLRNRAASEGINRADPPHKWLRSLVKYADGPLDRFGKPLRPARVH